MTLRSSRGNGTWRRCPRCRSYFTDEPFDASAESHHQASMFWGQVANARELNAYKQRMFDAALRLIGKSVPPPASIVDVGCSFGGFLVVARARGYAVAGIDLNREAVEYARSLGIRAEVASRIEAATVLPTPIDVITSFDCNYYWDDQPRELRAAYALLRPGGLIVLRTVDKSLLVTAGRSVARTFPAVGQRMVRFGLGDHRFSMPFRSLVGVVGDAGFEIAYASPRGALHSERTRPLAKLAFAIGTLAWERFGLGLGPGGLIVGRKAT